MKTAYTNFAVGVLYGFGLGVIVSQANLVSVASFSLLLAFLVGVPFIVWSEMYVHRLRRKNWAHIQEQGKFMFIFSRYVLMRGGIATAILLFATVGSIASALVREVVIPILLVTLAYIGHQEWENCSRESKRSWTDGETPADRWD
jgi:hypothetical protein